MTEPRHVPAPAAEALPPIPPAPYERTRWESAVLARQLHNRETLVALILSHHAGPGGVLPENGIQRSQRMRTLTRIGAKSIRECLSALERHGLLSRLPYTPGTSRQVARAIVLTVPVRREDPPPAGARP